MAKVNGKARSKAVEVRRPRKRLASWTPKKKLEFLTMVAAGWTVLAAAAKVGLSQSAVYELRSRDEAFRAGMEQAYEDSTALLEGVAFRKASGWIEVKIDKDGNAYEVSRYDPILLMFLLKARKPKMYRDQVDVNINEKRHILLELVQLEKDEATGRLMMVDEAAPPLLTSGEGKV